MKYLAWFYVANAAYNALRAIRPEAIQHGISNPTLLCAVCIFFAGIFFEWSKKN